MGYNQRIYARLRDDEGTFKFQGDFYHFFFSWWEMVVQRHPFL